MTLNTTPLTRRVCDDNRCVVVLQGAAAAVIPPTLPRSGPSIITHLLGMWYSNPLMRRHVSPSRFFWSAELCRRTLTLLPFFFWCSRLLLGSKEEKENGYMVDNGAEHSFLVRCCFITEAMLPMQANTSKTYSTELYEFASHAPTQHPARSPRSTSPSPPSCVRDICLFSIERNTSLRLCLHFCLSPSLLCMSACLPFLSVSTSASLSTHGTTRPARYKKTRMENSLKIQVG